MAINCCKGCVPPTRYPGCHGKCSAYLSEQEKHEAMREKYIKARAVECGLESQIIRGIYRTKKG